MTAYYNENDPKAAAWLRELIKQGAIASGDVDERSIEDVLPNDLRDYTQCHFFAGIGGWSYALRLAGWPDDRPVWTGSCPCQPFSAAGKGAGFADERHLWPAFHWLIDQRRPDIIFGEQVANALDWLDLVSTDLEGKQYTVGTTLLGAHSVGAPHVRKRLYWCAAHADYKGQRHVPLYDEVERKPQFESLANADSARLQGLYKTSRAVNLQSAESREQRYRMWLPEPEMDRMVDGVPDRMGLLRGYGNAIVPQVAAEFIGAYIDTANIDLIQ
jgi:DNA (cytosine-5)-methyltransferase 1